MNLKDDPLFLFPASISHSNPYDWNEPVKFHARLAKPGQHKSKYKREKVL